MRTKIRFWTLHPGNAEPVQITIKAGETLHHYWHAPTDEGWTSEAQQWHFDGRRVTCEWCNDGRDCDGRLTRGGSSYFEARDRTAGADIDGLRFPYWQDGGDGYQRDEYAELANY